MKFNILALIFTILAVVPSAMAEETKRIVAIGDSLTAGYGLPAGEDFVTRLEAALQAKGYDVTVENAGVSGDTTAGGLQRLDWAIGNGADYVILELGANDALRGIEPEETRRNLSRIIEILQEKDIPVLLAGMRAPPNMGSEYTTAFDKIFPDLASRYKTGYYPFFLDGVAADPNLNQDDYIHPNAEGVNVIVGNILPFVTAFIEQ
ncbi:arylesterase [Sneathiella chungangensis]|uniref:Arylesterase n=1 Tax=Sneathiella chungangensis TaxID=1418234 RepID=A0A845MJA2_9PROT|nr:arylesterase [Sneathiella chungangensis]MZR23357.1 arylesterase [Sneathiella chungangensis]